MDSKVLWHQAIGLDLKEIRELAVTAQGHAAAFHEGHKHGFFEADRDLLNPDKGLAGLNWQRFACVFPNPVKASRGMPPGYARSTNFEPP